MRDYTFRSRLAPFIDGLIREKRSNGFVYDSEAYVYSVFDYFIVENGFDDGSISKELIASWSMQRATEGTRYRNKRVYNVRQLALYMLSIGENPYVPEMLQSDSVSAPYILSRTELQDFLNAVDQYKPKNEPFKRIAAEYKIMFRIYYCCGLRLSEGVNLRKSDVDLNNGTFDIMQSKGDKDRRVFMSDDLTEMCIIYNAWMDTISHNREWFFPGFNIDKPFHISSLDSKFKYYWRQCHHFNEGKNPTLHSLRHTFVVDCMTRWMKEGRDIDVMMPYLARQLGHKSIDGSLYYYHTTIASASVIQDKNKGSLWVIPAVSDLSAPVKVIGGVESYSKRKCKCKPILVTINKKIIPEIKSL